MAQPERRFIIVTPYQSVGKPGTTVTASQLSMSDEKLDEWVDAGHAQEIYPEPPAAPKPTTATKVTRAAKKSSSGGTGDSQ